MALGFLCGLGFSVTFSASRFQVKVSMWGAGFKFLGPSFPKPRAGFLRVLAAEIASYLRVGGGTLIVV